MENKQEEKKTYISMVVEAIKADASKNGTSKQVTKYFYFILDKKSKFQMSSYQIFISIL